MLKKFVTGFWIIDPKTGKPSVSLTLMMWSVVISTLLLIFSQFETIGGITLREYTTTDVMTHTGPFLALYFGRKFTSNDDKAKSPESGSDK